MPRIELLDPTQNGRLAEHMENKLGHLIVRQEEAIYEIVSAYQTHLVGLSPVRRPIGNFLFLGGLPALEKPALSSRPPSLC
jgi:ATP-dependent Clp protease ATP-binding subunit ClpA